MGERERENGRGEEERENVTGVVSNRSANSDTLSSHYQQCCQRHGHKHQELATDYGL